MRLSSWLSVVGLVAGAILGQEREQFLTWDTARVLKEVKAMQAEGRVVGNSGIRVRSTNQASSYKIRATWMTPEVIRATARQLQIRNRLSDAETMALVAEAESVADTVFMIEIDPIEGSGVIPLDWAVFLQPKGLKEGATGGVLGTSKPQLKSVKALGGAMQRDYAYEVFWLSFPLVDKGKLVLPDTVREAELVVNIYGKEGKLSWTIPPSVRNVATLP